MSSDKKESKAKFDRKAYMREYRKRNAEKYQEYSRKYYKDNSEDVLRRQLLYGLNKYKNREAPKPESIEKYNLKYDKKKKEWY
jgi:hypothetical protein